MISGLGSGSVASAACIAGSIGADTTTARARLSASMNANSPGLSWVLTATGTTPGLDRPEKGGRKIDAVLQAEQDALFRVKAEPPRKIGEPANPPGELRIAVLPSIVDDRDLGPAPGSEVALDQVGGRVVGRFAVHRAILPVFSGPER